MHIEATILAKHSNCTEWCSTETKVIKFVIVHDEDIGLSHHISQKFERMVMCTYMGVGDCIMYENCRQHYWHRDGSGQS